MAAADTILRQQQEARRRGEPIARGIEILGSVLGRGISTREQRIYDERLREEQARRKAEEDRRKAELLLSRRIAMTGVTPEQTKDQDLIDTLGRLIEDRDSILATIPREGEGTDIEGVGKTFASWYSAPDHDKIYSNAEKLAAQDITPISGERPWYEDLDTLTELQPIHPEQMSANVEWALDAKRREKERDIAGIEQSIDTLIPYQTKTPSLLTDEELYGALGVTDEELRRRGLSSEGKPISGASQTATHQAARLDLAERRFAYQQDIDKARQDRIAAEDEARKQRWADKLAKDATDADRTQADEARKIEQTIQADYDKATDMARQSIQAYNQFGAIYTVTDEATGLPKTDDAGNVIVDFNNPTGAQNVAAIFSFMKTLDPASVVRESEFELIAQIAGWKQWAEQQAAKLESGVPLPPNVIAELWRVMSNIKDIASRKIREDQEKAQAKIYNSRNLRLAGDYLQDINIDYRMPNARFAVKPTAPNSGDKDK